MCVVFTFTFSHVLCKNHKLQTEKGFKKTPLYANIRFYFHSFRFRFHFRFLARIVEVRFNWSSPYNFFFFSSLLWSLSYFIFPLQFWFIHVTNTNKTLRLIFLPLFVGRKSNDRKGSRYFSKFLLTSLINGRAIFKLIIFWNFFIRFFWVLA